MEQGLPQRDRKQLCQPTILFIVPNVGAYSLTKSLCDNHCPTLAISNMVSDSQTVIYSHSTKIPNSSRVCRATAVGTPEPCRNHRWTMYARRLYGGTIKEIAGA